MFKHKLFEGMILKPIKRINIKHEIAITNWLFELEEESGILFVDINTGEHKEISNRNIARLLYHA